MKKDEIFDLILKAAAIYLFGLAIISTPKVAGSLILIILRFKYILATFVGEATPGEIMMSATINSLALADILQFVIYFIVGRNLYNGGSWLKLFFKKKLLNDTIGF